MVRDLKGSVNELAKALAKLLNIDPKSWSLKWDFSNFIDQMGEFSKMLNMIADLLNAIKDGRWADAVSIGKQILNQGSENPSAMPMVTDSANSTADWIKEHWDSIPAVWAGRYAAGLVMMSRNNMHRLRNEENGITIRETLILLVRQGLLLNARAGDLPDLKLLLMDYGLLLVS